MGSDVPCELNSVPADEVGAYIGTPSITYRAFDDWRIDFSPRMTTFEAPPTPDDEALIVTPATFPESELMKLTSLFETISSDDTCCTLYDRAFSERLIPRAVTTTASTCCDSSWSVKSIDVRLPTGASTL